VQSAIHIKSDKNNVICIQHADKERFKTQPKQSLATDFRMLQFINYSIKVWYTQFIQHSCNALIFAKN